MSRRVLVAAIVAPLLMIALIVAIAGSMTYWFGLARPVTNAGQAQSLCEDAVRHNLLAPTNASFQDVDARQDHLSEDDTVGLGFDSHHVKEVWAVDGDVKSPGVSGVEAQSRFTCRAYLFDNQTPRAYGHYSDRNDAGQWVIRP
jgi:hypothetical protein